MRLLLILLSALFTSSAVAQKRVAVLPVQTGNIATAAEKVFLTDLLRGIAGNELNQAGFVVMDRQNFQAFLGSDVSLEDCVGSCVVDTGSKLQAHFVVSAKLSKVFGAYRLTLSAHNTKTRAQLRQVVIKINTKPEFETRIVDEAPKLFRRIADTQITAQAPMRQSTANEAVRDETAEEDGPSKTERVKQFVKDSAEVVADVGKASLSGAKKVVKAIGSIEVHPKVRADAYLAEAEIHYNVWKDYRGTVERMRKALRAEPCVELAPHQRTPPLIKAFRYAQKTSGTVCAP